MSVEAFLVSQLPSVSFWPALPSSFVAWRAFSTMSHGLGVFDSSTESCERGKICFSARPSRSTCRVQEPSKVLCIKRVEMQQLASCSKTEDLRLHGREQR